MKINSAWSINQDFSSVIYKITKKTPLKIKKHSRMHQINVECFNTKSIISKYKIYDRQGVARSHFYDVTPKRTLFLRHSNSKWQI